MRTWAAATSAAQAGRDDELLEAIDRLAETLFPFRDEDPVWPMAGASLLRCVGLGLIEYCRDGDRPGAPESVTDLPLASCVSMLRWLTYTTVADLQDASSFLWQGRARRDAFTLYCKVAPAAMSSAVVREYFGHARRHAEVMTSSQLMLENSAEAVFDALLPVTGRETPSDLGRPQQVFEDAMACFTNTNLDHKEESS